MRGRAHDLTHETFHGQAHVPVFAGHGFDEVYAHILHMADALSEGIVKQFPNKFT